ncbi:hypothetical protein HRR83_000215 [Exophiala dermatitidis]|uniref:Beta-lactamase n=2 Tax=Exophiala dermatitidis TaxID=5970 RepID=H6C8M7_EXODN|nr:beta-lactamase [Exophiala dermatitidis NIH/UT8656]KAJ4523568.1 hypothetical protein HRR73_002751 [Exophiala dermatitidis]EHY60454.1 beta-lactamase [Exophiala dermatitidis NIH/UT8656]KAJ4531029.1 hypothetical protein HRR76_008713 [Exophiala dermatitidis]KAJ4581770.1 hypothetical protein HRR79_000780 [Exophiala dermatitidis]KAJ4584972.1 hypothetical protein HRR81_000779 [Exophiala dermatitidis]
MRTEQLFGELVPVVLVWGWTFIIMSCGFFAYVHAHDSPFHQEFDACVSATLEEWRIPGLSVAVVDKDGIIHSKAYGYSHLYPPVAADTSTLYYLGSLTKSLTAALTAIVIDETPSISWDTAMSKLLPDIFTTEDDQITPLITIESLLSHSSGLPSHESYYLDREITPFLPHHLVQEVWHWPLHHRPGQVFQYCNAGYVAVTLALERLTGSSYAELLDSKLFRPLGMKSSHASLQAAGCDLSSCVRGASSQHAETGLLARGYRWLFGQLLPVRWVNEPAVSGAGAIIATASDYARFVRSMMFRANPISPSGHLNLTAPRITVSESAWAPWNPLSTVKYALGWVVTRYRNETVYSHVGSINGFSSVVLFTSGHSPVAVVILSNNQQGRNGLRCLAFRLFLEVSGIAQESYATYEPKEHEEFCI